MELVEFGRKKVEKIKRKWNRWGALYTFFNAINHVSLGVVLGFALPLLVVVSLAWGKKRTRKVEEVGVGKRNNRCSLHSATSRPWVLLWMCTRPSGFHVLQARYAGILPTSQALLPPPPSTFIPETMFGFLHTNGSSTGWMMMPKWY